MILKEAVPPGKAAEWILPLACLLSELPRVSVLPAVERRVRTVPLFRCRWRKSNLVAVETPQGAPGAAGLERLEAGTGSSIQPTRSAHRHRRSHPVPRTYQAGSCSGSRILTDWKKWPAPD